MTKYFLLTEVGVVVLPLAYESYDEAADAKRAFEQILGVPCYIHTLEANDEHTLTD